MDHYKLFGAYFLQNVHNKSKELEKIRKIQKGTKRFRCYIKARRHISVAVRSIAGDLSDIPDPKRPAMIY